LFVFAGNHRGTEARTAEWEQAYTGRSLAKSNESKVQQRAENPEGKNGAVERIRTFTVLLPPAPQAGASASSATTAKKTAMSYIRLNEESVQLHP
jgi:hypothetical protein